MPKRERGDGALIKIRGCRYWYAQIYRDGKQRRISTRTPVKQKAKSFLRKLVADKDSGAPFIGDLNRIRYGDLRADLFANYMEKGNKSLLTDGQGEEFINGIKPLDDFFGYRNDKDASAPLTKITTDAAREFARKRLKEGLTNDTVNNSLALLRRMLRLAQEDGKIAVVPKIHLLKRNPARKGFLPREKFDELLKHLPARLRPLITFLYYCGVRLGEALQVEWTQVDLETPVIRLEEEQTKTGEARTVPLPDVLVSMLKKVKPKHGCVFDGTNLRKDWAKACVAVRLGTLTPVDKNGNRRYTGLTIHDLRRSAVKNLMSMGVRERVAMEISGHKTRSVFDRYHIVDESDKLDAMRRVENAPVAATNLTGDGEKSVKKSLATRRSRMLKS